MRRLASLGHGAKRRDTGIRAGFHNENHLFSLFSPPAMPLRFFVAVVIELRKKKLFPSSLPGEPDVGDCAAVLEDRLDGELVDVGLDVAHVDGGAELLLLSVGLRRGER